MSQARSAWRGWVAAVAVGGLLAVGVPGAAAGDGKRERERAKTERSDGPGIPDAGEVVEDTLDGATDTVGEPGGRADDQEDGEPGSRAKDDEPEYPYQSPGVSPPGANDFSCEPSRDKPFPVVLVHGTFGDQTVSWNVISPALKAEGYCVFALDYGERATERMQRSAKQLREFVHLVLDATGARRVSLVGHSQGGMMPRWWIRFLDGRNKVEDLIGLSPSNHGTTNPFAPPADEGGDCRACGQQVKGSGFLDRLNHRQETFGRIDYTVVQTRYDEVVTPFKSAFLNGSRRNVTNVLIQDRCPADPVEHNGIMYDPVALQWILEALGRDGPADPDFRPACA